MFSLTEITLALSVIVIAWTVIRLNDTVRNLSVRLDVIEGGAKSRARARALHEGEGLSWSSAGAYPQAAAQSAPLESALAGDTTCANCGREFTISLRNCPYCNAPNTDVDFGG